MRGTTRASSNRSHSAGRHRDVPVPRSEVQSNFIPLPYLDSKPLFGNGTFLRHDPELTDCGACFIVSACRAPTDWGRFFANRPHRKSLKFRSCLRTGRRTCILVGGLIKRSALYEETALAADSAGRAGGWMLVVVGDMAADVRRAGRLQSGVYLRRARYYSLASCRSSPSVRLAGLGEPTGIQ